MAYGDVIDALSPNHRWSFDNTVNDQVGTVHGTASGTTFVTTPLCEDASYSLLTDAVADRLTLPSTTDINNSAQTRKAFAGWFMTTAINDPPKRIYGEGDTTTSFAFIMGWGNNVIYEVDDANFTIQIFGNTHLAPNRKYHLCMVFEGNGYGNELRAYLDGVEQLGAYPTDRQPDYATLTARTVGEFGDPVGTVAVGGKEVILNSPVNGNYNEWASWDGAVAVLTDSEIRTELFEKGALPDVTISSGTQSAMQTALDAYSSTTRADAPLCIRIEANTGDTDLTLELDDITFNSLASIHVQYVGTAALTLINTNGSDCSITSVTNGGTIVLKTEVSVTVTAKDAVDFSNIQTARALMLAATGGDLPFEESVTIVRSASTATVTHTAHGLVTGDGVSIVGANQQEYNGIYTITVTGVNTYTYTVSGTPDTPATGTITSTAVIINDLTDVNGEVTTLFGYTSDQPFSGRIRKGSASTFYQTSVISGTILSSGLNIISLLVGDE